MALGGLARTFNVDYIAVVYITFVTEDLHVRTKLA